MPNESEAIYIPIRVTAGIILRIGAGIYHSVAGALKELVSNSFDADATSVVITTNYPNYDEINVVDNGYGMTAERFGVAMGTIGTSLKGIFDRDRNSPKFKRPIIGHLGIGFMSLTQICDEVTLESQVEGSKIKFVAELDFSVFSSKEKEHANLSILEVLRDRYGGLESMQKMLNDPSLDSDKKKEIEWYQEVVTTQAEESLKNGPDDNPDDEHLGYCIIYPNLPAVPGEHGTTITLRKIKKGIIEVLKDTDRTLDGLPKLQREKGISWDSYRNDINSLEWEEICEKLRRGIYSYQSLPQYHQFLYELSLLTPIEYISNGPLEIKPEILLSKKENLKNFRFILQVDKYRLFKPTLLPSGNLTRIEKSNLEEGYDYYCQSFDSDSIVDEEQLRYSGYIYWQREQNQPNSQRGIHIYIRNTGIGGYDQTLLNFSTVNPTSRAGQISGEIYVEDGLERALNVDRNSFRQTDAHYLALQQHIWKILGSGSVKDGILGKSVEAYYKRKERTDSQEQEEHIEGLLNEIQEVGNEKIILTLDHETEIIEPYKIENDHIIIYNRSPRWPKSLDNRQISQRILLVTKVAIMSGANPDELYNILEKMLLLV